MNIGKLVKTVVRKVKANPEIALIAVGVVAPKAVGKVAKVIAAVKAAD